MKLNESLHLFIKNLRTAYRGPIRLLFFITLMWLVGRNSVSHQLPYHRGSHHPEVVDDKYSEEEDSDEALPLGPEFQAHVDIFVDYAKVCHAVPSHCSCVNAERQSIFK